MKAQFVLALAMPLAAVAAPAAIPTFTNDEIMSGKAIQVLGKIAYDTAMARIANNTQGCTPQTVKIRKEWYVSKPHQYRKENMDLVSVAELAMITPLRHRHKRW